MESNHPDLETLSRFSSMESLGKEQLSLLASIVTLETANPGTRLMQQGNNDDVSLFLVKGKLRLLAKDGKTRSIDAGDASARSPIAQLRPRMYDVDAETVVEYLRIDNHLLQDILKSGKANALDSSGYLVSESHLDDESLTEKLATALLADLEKDQLKLPSLPDVAVRIGRALRDDISDAETIAAMIQIDPVITAKLIKAANSAMYGRRVPVETCAGAVIRLGADVTHKLVVSYAMKELFRSKSPMLQRRMKALWSHSTRVAALSYVLALRDNRFQAENALLMGLLHDIGAVAIYNYVSDLNLENVDEKALTQTVDELKGRIGAMILSKWSFPQDFSVVAAECENWKRDTGGAPDYCDLVIAAQLHSFIGTAEAMDVPSLDEAPALERLGLGELTPKMSLKILERAKQQVADAEALLNF